MKTSKNAQRTLYEYNNGTDFIIQNNDFCYHVIEYKNYITLYVYQMNGIELGDEIGTYRIPFNEVNLYDLLRSKDITNLMIAHELIKYQEDEKREDS